MDSLDIESLLAEIDSENPCGQDIAYDPAYLHLEGELRPRSVGAVVSEQDDQEREPNWRDVETQCLELFQRSKHLNVGVFLVISLLKTKGLSGFRNGLSLIAGLLDRFWDHVYPLLDPDDNHDPIERLNILQALSPQYVSDQDPVQCRRRLAEVPLCHSRRLGAFGLHDILVARAEVPVSRDDAEIVADPAVIGQTFRETPPEELEAGIRAVSESIEQIEQIERIFSEKAVDGQGPDLSGLKGDLKKIRLLVQEYTQGGPIETSPPDETADHDVCATKSTTPSLPGEINSRKDALTALEKVCRYFERQEPSSPIPLLLRRAQRLVSKNFIEIVKDICPDAMDRVEVISGEPPQQENHGD